MLCNQCSVSTEQVLRLQLRASVYLDYVSTLRLEIAFGLWDIPGKVIWGEQGVGGGVASTLCR
jgi:hypothetical protein